MLTGDLVTLRALTPADFDALYVLAADAETWEQRSPRPLRPVDRGAWDARMRERLADVESVEFGIEADGTLVGRCALLRPDTLARHAEVAISLVAGARGRGYGTDALRVLVDVAFTRHNLHRVHLTVLASNAAAIASYRKVGFVEEGRLREHAWVRGAYEDELRMGLLRAHHPAN